MSIVKYVQANIGSLMLGSTSPHSAPDRPSLLSFHSLQFTKLPLLTTDSLTLHQRINMQLWTQHSSPLNFWGGEVEISHLKPTRWHNTEPSFLWLPTPGLPSQDFFVSSSTTEAQCSWPGLNHWDGIKNPQPTSSSGLLHQRVHWEQARDCTNSLNSLFSNCPS